MTMPDPTLSSVSRTIGMPPPPFGIRAPAATRSASSVLMLGTAG
jgi:hypothetical protein